MTELSQWRTPIAQVKVARLAAAGRSDKEIAGELHISHRTVENRLQRVYTKLVISSRHDLPAALTDS